MRHLPRFGLPDTTAPADPWEPLRRPPRHNDEALAAGYLDVLRRFWPRH